MWHCPTASCSYLFSALTDSHLGYLKGAFQPSFSLIISALWGYGFRWYSSAAQGMCVQEELVAG